MSSPWYDQLNQGVNKLTRRIYFLWQKFLLRECLCVGHISITHRGLYMDTYRLLLILKYLCLSLFGWFSFWEPTHQIFCLISSFLCNRGIQVVLDGNSLQEYLGNARNPQESIFGSTFSLVYINGHRDDVIGILTIYADDTTLYPKSGHASDLWKQLQLVSELESHLRDALDWGRKWLLDFKAGKAQLVLLDWSKRFGAINVKIDRSILEWKSSFKMLGMTSSSKLDWDCCIISISITAPKKIGALIRPMKFLSPEVACISINLAYGPVWNTVVMSELVLLVATWNCWISYKTGFTGLLVLRLLPLLNHCVVVEI